MNIKEKIKQVATSHNLMTLATVDADGLPKARSVDFAMGDDESMLYFITFKGTDKVEELKRNNNVYVVIDHDCNSMAELQNLKYFKATGKAYLCDTPDEIQKAFGLLMQKLPFLKDLPGEPSDFIAFRVELEKVTVIDNAVSFGHNEQVAYR